MTLPTGTITMGQVRTELGLSGPITLGQSNVRSLAGVPSGAITMNSLRGKSNQTVQLIAQTIYGTGAQVPDPQTYDKYMGQQGSASITLSTSGSFQTFTSDGWSYQTYGVPFNWLLSGAVGDYEVYASVTSFAGSGGFFGPFNSWTTLATTRQWGYNPPTKGTDGGGSIYLQIRKASTTGILAAATMDIGASWPMDFGGGMG